MSLAYFVAKLIASLIAIAIQIPLRIVAIVFPKLNRLWETKHSNKFQLVQDKDAPDGGDSYIQSGPLKLYCKKWIPAKGKVIGRLFVLHGAAEHHGRYLEFIEKMVSKGFIVHAIDHQGHGRSAGDRLYVEKFEDYVDDVARWITDVVQADEKNKSLPNYVFGHSNGGKIALMLAIGISQRKYEKLPQIESFAVCAPGLYSDANLNKPIVRGIINGLSDIFPKLLAGKIPNDTLSHDPDVLKKIEQDQFHYKGGIPLRFASEFGRAGDFCLENAHHVVHPILIVHGNNDKLVPIQFSYELLNKLKSTNNKKMIAYPEMYHELLNEPLVKEKVTEEIFNFFVHSTQ